MTNKEQYIKGLEVTIQKFLEPVGGIPFPIAIKALTGFEVIPFDKEKRINKDFLKKLIKAAQIAGEQAFEEGIFTDRPNEAGNRIEPFVLQALNETGLKATKPQTMSGKRKAAGYPDIQVISEEGLVSYLDCKTFSTRTKEQSFRTFYFSPSDDPKITANAYHLLMSFELDIALRNNETAFVPISWQIYTLDKLLVEVKHEFNASNRDLYKPEALLAQGRITK